MSATKSSEDSAASWFASASEGTGREKFADLGAPSDLGERIAHLVYFGEPFEHGDQPPVFVLRTLQVDDVVVEIVFAGARRDRDQLFAGSMNEHRAQRADFGRDVDPGHGAQS